MKKPLLLLTLPFLAIGLGAAGPADDLSGSPKTVIGNSTEARLCATHARMVANGLMSPADAVQTCTIALDSGMLSPYDQAATHNNRGVVLLDMNGGLTPAAADFNEAERIFPTIGETYNNQGSTLLRQERYGEALPKFDHALELGVKEPWRVHFNRAIAREQTGDVRGAYADYMTAQELNPAWEAPKTELARFQVQRR